MDFCEMGQMWLLWDEQDANVTQGSPTPPATAAPVTLQKEIVWVNYAMQKRLTFPKESGVGSRGWKLTG